MITLLAALNVGNTSTKFLYVLPPIANRHEVCLSDDHSGFKEGIRLKSLSSFCDAVRRMLGEGKRPLGGGQRPKGRLSEDALTAVRRANRTRWDTIRKMSESHEQG